MRRSLSTKSHVFDLHMHTHYSDGGLSPLELIRYVSECGVKYAAITDHDSITGCKELFTVMETGVMDDIDIDLIPGVEISCKALNREIHVVGLQVSLNSNQLNTFLENQQKIRQERVETYVYKLKELGLDLNTDIAHLKAESLTRAHLARLLIEKKMVPNMDKAFKHYLGARGKVYVDIEWPSLEETIAVIQNAGGVAVLAHPSRYLLSKKQLSELLEYFAESGGHAIELSFPNIQASDRDWLAKKAKELDLLASQGSDFHLREQSWIVPGRFPVLPSSVLPIWTLWS